MQTITIAETAREHSNRRAGCEQHPADGRPPPGYAAVLTPSSTQSSRSWFPPGLTRRPDFDDAEYAILPPRRASPTLAGKQI
jgi:hypothetical protein